MWPFRIINLLCIKHDYDNLLIQRKIIYHWIECKKSWMFLQERNFGVKGLTRSRVLRGQEENLSFHVWELFLRENQTVM